MAKKRPEVVYHDINGLDPKVGEPIWIVEENCVMIKYVLSYYDEASFCAVRKWNEDSGGAGVLHLHVQFRGKGNNRFHCFWRGATGLSYEFDRRMDLED